MLKEQSLSTHRPIESRMKFHNLQNISEAFTTKKNKTLQHSPQQLKMMETLFLGELFL